MKLGACAAWRAGSLSRVPPPFFSSFLWAYTWRRMRTAARSLRLIDPRKTLYEFEICSLGFSMCVTMSVVRQRPLIGRPRLCRLRKRDLQVLVNVNLLAAQIDHLVRLAEARYHLVRVCPSPIFTVSGCGAGVAAVRCAPMGATGSGFGGRLWPGRWQTRIPRRSFCWICPNSVEFQYPLGYWNVSAAR